MYHENNKLYIIMELIPGVTLQKLWPSLSEHDKMFILNELRIIFDQMRRLAPPVPGFYGNVAKGFVPHFLFRTFENIVSVSGPFDNEQEFNLGLAQQFGRIWDMNKKYSSKTSFYQRHLSAVLCNHPPTFTHSDVQRKNIIVSIDDSTQSTDGPKQMNYKVTVIDWENAGWYPSYWEYFAAFTGVRWDDDWATKAETFIEPWPAETAMMKMVYTDLFF